ncbi:MAG: hypothetical protein RTV72_07480 [Candidatus Thorarchaeota archaeon]
MPHTGVIDETLEGEEALLMRAKLHFQEGLNRFSKGMTADAIAAMYDALSSAMQRIAILNKGNRHLFINEKDDLLIDSSLFKILLQSKIFDESTTEEDFDFIERTLNDAFEDQLESFEETTFLEITIGLLKQLDVVSEEIVQIHTDVTSQLL